jgi:hypothetical protein
MPGWRLRSSHHGLGISVVVEVSGFPLGISSVVGDGAAPAAVASRVRKAPSSPMVLISGAGKTTVVFWSTPISTRLCRWPVGSCGDIPGGADPRQRDGSELDSPSNIDLDR